MGQKRATCLSLHPQGQTGPKERKKQGTYWLVRSRIKPKMAHFFSSGLADVALRLGPNMRISSAQNGLYMDSIGRMRNGKSKQTKQQPQNQDDPQIPRPDLRFVRTTANQTNKRGKSPNENTHKRDLPKTQRWRNHCVISQKHAIKGPDNPTSQLLPTSNKRKAKTAWDKQEREKRW